MLDDHSGWLGIGNPLARLRARSKIVDMLSDAIWPLGIHMPAAPVQEGLRFERWPGILLGHALRPIASDQASSYHSSA